MRFVIRGGRIVDPSCGRDETGDLFIAGGRICRPFACQSGEEDLRVIDARGLLVAPGLIDLHVHFREPGQTHKETIRTGSLGAAAGGYTTVCCMPNTNPAIDSPQTLLEVDRKGRAAGAVNLLAACAMTVGRQGKALASIEEMDRSETRCRELNGHGVCAATEDGGTLMDPALMEQVCRLAAGLDLLIMDHTEDHRQSGGCMNEGAVSRELGVPGIPAYAEETIVARDIRLAAETGCRMHLQHISTAGSIERIRQAKQSGVAVTAETAPHYFALTEQAVLTVGSMAKMNPPLRTETDREAVLEGLRDGTIDLIATDHAPHTLEEKQQSLLEAPFGIAGLETGFAVSYTVLVKGGHLTLADFLDKMSTAPARLAGLPRGTLAPGAVADLAIFDLKTPYTIEAADFLSMGRNTPFQGLSVIGRPILTICGGTVTYDKGVL